jgi:hypothetical protein
LTAWENSDESVVIEPALVDNRRRRRTTAMDSGEIDASSNASSQVNRRVEICRLKAFGHAAKPDTRRQSSSFNVDGPSGLSMVIGWWADPSTPIGESIHLDYRRSEESELHSLA